jgi:hypothetical protein
MMSRVGDYLNDKPRLFFRSRLFDLHTDGYEPGLLICDLASLRACEV